MNKQAFIEVKLTAEDLAVYEAIEELYSLQGYSPSTRELMAKTGLKSKDTINHHVVRLHRAGWISRQPKLARAIVPVRYPRVHYVRKEQP